jgi:hypothetical protein
MDDPLNQARIEYLRAWREIAQARFRHIIDLSSSIFRQLIFLNGGAIVSLFTLLGHDQALKPVRSLLLAGFASFVAGLCCTLAGMAASFFAQNHFFMVEHLQAERIGAEIMQVEVKEGTPLPTLRLGVILRAAAIALSVVGAVAFGGGCYLSLLAVLH